MSVKLSGCVFVTERNGGLQKKRRRRLTKQDKEIRKVLDIHTVLSPEQSEYCICSAVCVCIWANMCACA